jgi:hypothetical protein
VSGNCTQSLGCNSHLLDILQVTVISRGRPADLPEGEEGSCTFRHVDGSTTMASSYANAGLATADAVIIGIPRLSPDPHSQPLLILP